MIWKMLPGILLVTGMTLLGAMMVLVAYPAPREVSEDAIAVYRGGAPARCLTAPNINCDNALNTTCGGFACRQGTSRFVCPEGDADLFQTNNQRQKCTTSQPAGFATCYQGPGNNTITCISSRLCDQSACFWDVNAPDGNGGFGNWMCKSDLTNPTNPVPAYTYYIPTTGGTCP